MADVVRDCVAVAAQASLGVTQHPDVRALDCAHVVCALLCC